jgi:tetratricopeptide (TPR) repeat protein
VKPALGVAALAAALGLASCASTLAEPPRAAAYGDYLSGRIANLRDDHAAAADRYFAALARAPGDSALVNGALIASLASGDSVRARRAARMAGRTDAPGYAYIVRASDALAAGRWSGADQQLGLVEGAAAEELIARMLVVWARAGAGRVDDVVVDLAPLASIRPYGGLFAYQQAMALDYAGRQQEALAAYATAQQGGLWLPAGIERHADLLARSGDRAQAIALLSSDANRSNPALIAALARIEAGGAPAAATLDPARGAAVGLYGLAEIFLQEADSTSGLSALTLTVMLDPGFDGARLAFAQSQSDLGHADLARAALTGIAPTSPYASSARIMESWVLLEAGEQEAALALARANVESGDVRAQRTLADMYRNLDRFGDAEPLYASLITLQPTDWRLHFARGAARARLGRWPEAEADMQRALQLSPEQPDVMNFLGYSWVDRGERLTEGLAMIERAAVLRPMSGAIIDSLGWAHFRLGDYARALDILERAVELEPADPTLNDHLGDAYWRVGRRIEARFQWQRALTFAPEDSDTIHAKLESGLPAEPAAHSVRR